MPAENRVATGSKAVVSVQPDGRIVVKKGQEKAQQGGKENSEGATVVRMSADAIRDTAGAVEFKLERRMAA